MMLFITFLQFLRHRDAREGNEFGTNRFRPFHTKTARSVLRAVQDQASALFRYSSTFSR